jgi:predicted permease
MERLREWTRRVWYLLNRGRIEAALRAEMDAHRAEMSRPARFGNSLRLREEARDVWGWNWLDDLYRDLKVGLRALRRSPGFTVTALVILSLGIGVNLALFQIVNVVLLQPAAINSPETMVWFHRSSPRSNSTLVPYPLATYVRDHTNVLSAVLVLRPETMAWGDTSEERIKVAFVSAHWFDEMGGRASAGRLLREAVDATPAAAPAVVLTHAFWQRRLGSRADIVGSTVRINDRPVLVAGVTDARFPRLEFDSPEIWIAIDHLEYFQPGNRLRTDWSAPGVQMYGRLRDGISLDAARASLQTTMGRLSESRPADLAADEWLEPYSATTRFSRPRERDRGWTVVAAISTLTGLVLLITCLNVGNLTLARATSRLREMTIRTALGAGRWRVMRHLAVESLLLAAAGAGGGLVLGFVFASALVSIADLPLLLTIVPDWRTGLAASGTALVATLALGLAPAWKIGRQNLAPATRDGGERASQSLHATRLRHSLVACQIAGSCVLLVFAGQMLRSLHRVLAINQGFSLDAVAVLEPSLESFGIRGAAASAYWHDVRERIGTHPEAEHMTLVSSVPLGNGMTSARFAGDARVTFLVFGVEPAFFSTMRIPMIAGRPFRQDDTAETAAILSRRGALEMYGTLDVLGQGFPEGASAPVVVGIAGDAQLGRAQATDVVELYQPLRSGAAVGMLVRSRSDPAALVAPLREAARAADARVLPQVRLLRDDFNRAVEAPRLASTIAGLIALIAPGLTAVGIFGVVSYAAGLRTKEIGIRLALGAERGAIVRLLLRNTLRASAVGLSLGLIAGWPTSRLFAGGPFYLRPADPQMYAAAGLIFLGVGAAAALLPVWRSLRADPIRALRHD